MRGYISAVHANNRVFAFVKEVLRWAAESGCFTEPPINVFRFIKRERQRVAQLPAIQLCNIITHKAYLCACGVFFFGEGAPLRNMHACGMKGPHGGKIVRCDCIERVRRDLIRIDDLLKKCPAFRFKEALFIGRDGKIRLKPIRTIPRPLFSAVPVKPDLRSAVVRIRADANRAHMSLRNGVLLSHAKIATQFA